MADQLRLAVRSKNHMVMNFFLASELSCDQSVLSLCLHHHALGRVEVQTRNSPFKLQGNLEVVPPSLKEMIEACRMLKENCLLFCTDLLDFVEAACQFQGHLQKMRQEATKQTTIDMFFNYK